MVNYRDRISPQVNLVIGDDAMARPSCQDGWSLVAKCIALAGFDVLLGRSLFRLGHLLHKYMEC